jgi:hypothetical protein
MPSPIVRALTTPMIAAVVLVLALGALSLRNDPSGTLGTDTGIKVATLRVMEQQNTVRPALGYWAAPWDPTAASHAYRDTRRVGDAYFDVPTLPMVVAVYPLWRLGGYRAGLLVPLLALVATAFLARAFARRIEEGDGDGWAAFWLVGLASPLVLYALDLWEHTLGVATMAGAVLLLYDEVDQPRWWRGLGAGALFGVAFTMRTEALVYGGMTFAVVLVLLLRARRIGDAVRTGGGGAAGFVILFLGNIALELALVGESYRSGRASGTASAGASDLGLRAKEALVTSVSPFPSFEPSYLALGVGLALALVAAAVWGGSRSTRGPAVVGAAIAALIVFDRVSLDTGFWPGLLAATPLAAVALARGWHDERARRVMLFALVPLPVVFLFQFPGGALPQWGGRYLLTTAFLLMVVGVARLGALERWARFGFIGLSILVTAVGLVWMSSRTEQVADAGERVRTRPEQVLIAPDGFLAREFAATYGDKDWLSAPSLAETPKAVEVVRASGRTTFAVLTTDPSATLPAYPGFHETGRTTIPLIDPVNLIITSYAADGS